MARLLAVLALAAALAASYSLFAGAADQTVRGKQFQVSDPLPAGDGLLRFVTSTGKELASDNTVVGNPIANGATVEIIANGATSTDQSFDLPPGPLGSGDAGWKAISKPPTIYGYYYVDRAGLNGPVKAVVIRKTSNGTFTLQVAIDGRRGPGPQPHVTVLPPAPGTDGGIVFTIGGGGDRYCVAFGGTAGGVVINPPVKLNSNGRKVFKMLNATAEPGCPAASTTTTISTTTTSSTSSTTIPLFCGTLLTTWGSIEGGTGDGQFESPSAIAVDGSGNVYVADANIPRIQKFTSTGTFLAKWGSLGSGDGEFNDPLGIAADGVGNVYVADTVNDRIQKFTSSGTFLMAWGSSGTGDGQFGHPNGVAADGSGNVYVADSGNNRIQKFTSSGTFLTAWGTEGAGDGHFEGPVAVAVDGSNVYVADDGNDRIQEFTSSGSFLATWGSSGSGDGEFNDPLSVAVDGSGNVYVADGNNNRIQKFTSSGSFLAKWGSIGDGYGELSNPMGVAVDGSGNVYVADTLNSRIQKFACPAASTTTSSTTTTTLSTTSTTICAATSGTFCDPGNGTVFDAATGLQWEKKTTAVGSGVNTADLHDVDNPYSWAGCCGTCTGSNYCQPNAAAAATCLAHADGGTQGCSTCGSGTCNLDPFGDGAITTVWDWINQVNAANFAGFNDWRLPSENGRNTSPTTDPRQLETILLAPWPCATNPCIDPVFGPTASGNYWSASTGAPGPSSAWDVYFFNGLVGGDGKFLGVDVRAVR